MTRFVLRALLLLAPRAFRERYGAEFLTVHGERLARRESVPGRIALAAREVCGLGLTVVRLRMGATTSRRALTLAEGAAAGPPRHRHPSRTGGRVGAVLDGVGRDLRFEVRTLRRSPGFTIAAVAVLGLGIGANTAIFSAANAFLFRPLPFGDPDRLVMLYETNPEFRWTHAQAAPANVFDWREQVEAFEDVAIYSEFVPQTPYVRDGRPELLGVTSVTGNYFSVLGVRPALGRGFEPEETWAGADDVAVLSHPTWVSTFGADPGIVGRTIELGSASVRIVGVMPPGFDYPSERTQVWIPWGWEPAFRQQIWFRRAHFVRPVARLKTGIDPEQATAEFQLVVDRLKTEFPETNRVMGAGLMPLRDFLVMDVRAHLYVLLGAVALLLLLACTNVANLMLVRASDRARDVALRLALGAARSRVARQMLTEGVLLALAGGALGLGLGWAGVRALSLRQQVGIEGATELALDYRVILFTLVVALASALLFGSAPAIRSARGDLQEVLKDGGRHGRSRGGLKTVNALVVTEVALTLLLVVGAGLMVRTFLILRNIDPGFRTESVLALRFTIPSERYAERDQVLSFQDELERRLEGRAGIERVGIVGQLPLNGQSWSSQFQAVGWPPERLGLEILHRRADPGYFEALDIPLIRGRMFGPADGPDAPLVVLINETFARKHFAGEDPIGQRIAYDRVATPESTWYEIVGIVGDQLQVSPGEPPRDEVFENRRQDWGRSDWFVVRTTGDPTAATAAVRDALAEMDPLIPIAEVQSLRDVWRSSMAREEFLLTLLGVFAVSALLLAAVGVYGVTAQAARKRTHEIGIRLALGAGGGDVLRLILAQGLAVVGIGLVVGVATAMVATRAIGTFLYGVEPTDPLTLGVVVVLLTVVAAVACYVPARRATAVDPAASLRAD